MSLVEEHPHRYYDREDAFSLEGPDNVTLLQRSERSPQAGNGSGRSQAQGEGEILVARKTPSPAPPAVILTSAGYDHTIRFWDVIQGACIGTLQHNESQVNCLALSRDKLLLAAGGNPAIRLYDVVAATTMQFSGVSGAGELRGGTMAASDSSLTAATTTANILPVHIFEASATTVQSGGSGGNVISVAFHPEGSWLWSASEEGQLRVWDLQGTFSLKKEIHLGSPITAAVLHPDHEHALVGDELGRLRLIHMDLAETERADGPGEGASKEMGRMRERQKVGGLIAASAVTPNPSMGRHRVQVVAETRTSQRVAIRDVAISSDGNFVAAIDHRGQLHLWRLDRVLAAAPSASFTGETSSASGSIRVIISAEERDDLHMAASAEEQSVCILGFNYLASVNAHGSYGIKCMFSPDAAMVLTTSADTTARLWAMPSSGGPPPTEREGEGERGGGGVGGRENGKINVESNGPTISGISAADEASAEGGRTSAAGHVSSSNNLLMPPSVPSTSSRDVSRSGSPSTLAIPSSTISSLPLIQEFIGHTKWVWDCAFSADSAYVITASSDESICLWDVNSGLSIATYAGHSKAITCVALNDLPLQ